MAADGLGFKNGGSMKEASFNATTIRPQLAAAGVINGVVLDRRYLENVVVHVSTGAVAGAPDTSSVAYKVQHGTLADGSDMADLGAGTQRQGAEVSGTVADPAANKDSRIQVDLQEANRYIRVVATVAFTGGTTPSIGLQVGVLGSLRGEAPLPSLAGS